MYKQNTVKVSSAKEGNGILKFRAISWNIERCESHRLYTNQEVDDVIASQFSQYFYMKSFFFVIHLSINFFFTSYHNNYYVLDVNANSLLGVLFNILRVKKKEDILDHSSHSMYKTNEELWGDGSNNLLICMQPMR